jgi:FixJ family two-component response regulator
MSGKDLFLKMRSVNPDIKVIFISGYCHENDVELLSNIPEIKDFLQKPCNTETIVEAIMRVLSQ